MTSWQVIDTGIEPACAIMEYDAHLLHTLKDDSSPILHFYEWQNDSATFGYFVDPQKYLNLDLAKKRGLDLARRPTGGGIVFHIWDFAFSVVIPKHFGAYSLSTLENYAFINNAVRAVAKEFLTPHLDVTLIKADAQEIDMNCKNFCMAKPTKYDVMLQGKKIAGAAQRKTKEGFLHQGTIALVMPSEEYLSDVLLPGTKVLEAMRAFTCPLLGAAATDDQIKNAKKDLKQLIAKTFHQIEG